MLEWIGVFLGVLGITLTLRPPKRLSDKKLHGIYVAIMVCQAAIFGYFLWERNQRVDVLSAENEQMKLVAGEKAKLANQAAKLHESFPVLVGGDNCRAIAISALAFLEKWKDQIPETYAIAKSITVRSSAPFDGPGVVEKMDKQYDCERDAKAMRQVVKGLATQ